MWKRTGLVACEREGERKGEGESERRSKSVHQSRFAFSSRSSRSSSEALWMLNVKMSMLLNNRCEAKS